MEWNDWIELPPRGRMAFRAGALNLLAVVLLDANETAKWAGACKSTWMLRGWAEGKEVDIAWSHEESEVKGLYSIVLLLLTKHDTDGLRRLLSVIRPDSSVRWEDIKDFEQLRMDHYFRER